MSRIVRYAKRVFRQGIPDGLISVRYLLPFQSDLVKLHRRIWWGSKHPQIPRLIWLFLQLMFWAKWIFYYFWWSLYFVLKKTARQIENQYGISKPTQVRQCLSAGLGWSIPIGELYSYGMIHKAVNPLHYIYSSETTGWHNLQNQKHPKAKASQQLLGDKRAFASVMREKAFPVATELRDFDSQQPLSKQLKEADGQVFCKLRQGNQGLNAFQAVHHDGQITGMTHKGKILADAEQVDAAWTKLNKTGPLLVQRLLENHPDLVKMSGDNPLITLRVVTRNGHVGASNMTIPMQDGEDRKHLWLDVNVISGRPEFPEGQVLQHSEFYQQFLDLAQKAPAITPFWDEICEQSVRAHAFGFDLWAIAWDWAITPDGPILLEGNSGWGLHDWQMQMGSLIIPQDL